MADPLVDHVARALFEEFKVMAEAQNMPMTGTRPTSSDRRLALVAIRAVESYKQLLLTLDRYEKAIKAGSANKHSSPDHVGGVTDMIRVKYADGTDSREYEELPHKHPDNEVAEQEKRQLEFVRALRDSMD